MHGKLLICTDCGESHKYCFCEEPPCQADWLGITLF